MTVVKAGLKAQIFGDKNVDLEQTSAGEVLLIRSSNVMQTEKVIQQIRDKLPDSRITLIVQKDFCGTFAVDREIAYPFSGNFQLTDETRDFFAQFTKRNYPLVMVIYHDFPRRKYEEVEKCALACGGQLTVGVFPDGLIIEVDKNISRIRELATKLYQKLKNKIEENLK